MLELCRCPNIYGPDCMCSNIQIDMYVQTEADEYLFKKTDRKQDRQVKIDR